MKIVPMIGITMAALFLTKKEEEGESSRANARSATRRKK